MTASDFQPMSWNSEPVTNAKLNQMCSNTQWLYDRMPRLRYTSSSLTRDMQVKVLAGKTPYPVSNYDYVHVDVSFGQYFTSGCHPAVTATLEPMGAWRKKHVDVIHLGSAAGVEIDQTGFTAVIWTTDTPTLNEAGFIHWQAVGY